METAVAPARNPVDAYRQHRDAGLDHETAARQAMHSYGRRDLGEQLEQAGIEYEVEPHVEQEAVEVPTPSAFDVAENELQQKIAELQERRGELALDALTSEDARREVSALEVSLDEADREASRLVLARRED
jgi:hypothetical protein